MKHLKLLETSLCFCVLTACIPIRVISKYNPDVYNGYKPIQAYQKKNSIGHTDPQQREKDVLACGVRNLMGGILDLNVGYDGMTAYQVVERHIRIDNCMENNGYLIKSTESCTRKGKPTGFCN